MIDKDFDHVFYQQKYPETKDFLKAHSLKTGMSERQRLWIHYVEYGKNLGMEKHGKVMYLKPTQGLGNRLLTLSSAYAFTSLHDFYKLRVCWSESAGFSDEKFEDLFNVDSLPPSVELITLEDYESSTRDLLKLHEHFTQDKDTLNYTLKSNTDVYIDSSHELYNEVCNNNFCLESYACINWIFDTKLDNANELIQNLKPSEAVLQQIKKYKIDSNTIGVHIRRGDAAIGPWQKYYHQSPVQSFVDRIEQHKGKVFLATDSEEVENEIVSKFGKRIICTDKTFLNTDLTIHDTKPKQFEAVVEWFLLSKTKKMYGTNWSTFGQTASLNGGNQIEIINTSNITPVENDNAFMSAITVVKNRYDILRFSIHSWLQDPSIKEFVIVNWSSDDMNQEQLSNLDSRIKIVTVNGKEFFDCGGAMNVGVENATSDVIIKLDVDYVLNPFFSLSNWININYDKEFLTGDWEQKSVDNSVGFLEHLNGFVVCKKQHIIDAGMYMSNQDGYGWEDSDMYIKLEKLGLKRVKQTFSQNNVPIFHIPHTDYYRSKHYAQKNIKSSLVFNQNKSNGNEK